VVTHGDSQAVEGRMECPVHPGQPTAHGALQKKPQSRQQDTTTDSKDDCVPALLTRALDRAEWSPVPTAERATVTQRAGDRVGPKAGLDVVRQNSLVFDGESTRGLPVDVYML
jgi:hypothetical protein